MKPGISGCQLVISARLAIFTSSLGRNSLACASDISENFAFNTNGIK